MTRRGEQLREHILWTAKDVFLELGFERTSMDVVAVRASTSKRSLYAYFESKDALFLAVVGLVRELSLDRLGTPGPDGAQTAEAVVGFCARLAQLLLWEPSLRACRLFIAEAERIPEASAHYHDAIFATAHERLAAFVGERCGLEPATSAAIADELVGRALYPGLVRALLGVDEARGEPPGDGSSAAGLDLTGIRATVAALLPAGEPPRSAVASDGA